jgi:uncharacterized membrane protein YfcA
MSMYAVLMLCGGLAGVTTVLFGFGGGFVVVPLLYTMLTMTHAAGSAVAQAAMQIAVATSSCVMIFGASMATWRHHRAGNVDWPRIRAMGAYIAVGAVVGAAAASWLNGDWVRWAFVAYLAVTIVDSTLRPGFMHAGPGTARPMTAGATAAIGIGIGAIAAFLGVGGSVMTVPLMRRRGATMTQATAMANPLSLPMAIAATVTYVALAWQHGATFGPGHAGHVDLLAFVVLAAGSWVGIRLAARWIGRIPDRVHAVTYVALLALVLVMMVAGGSLA